MTKHTLLLSACLLLPATLPAQPMPPMPPPMASDPGLPWDVALTDAQRTAIQAVLDRHRPIVKRLMGELMAAEHAFREAMDDPATTDARLGELHRALSEASLALLLDRRAQEREVQEQMTPAQRQQVQEERRRRRPQVGMTAMPMP